MATTGRCEEGSVSLTPALSQGRGRWIPTFAGDDAVGERPGHPQGAPLRRWGWGVSVHLQS